MEIKLPTPIERLVARLRKLPGVGSQTALRHVWELLRWKESDLAALAEELATLKQQVTPCPVCGFYTEGGGLCQICASENRDRTKICVVETAPQVPVLERTGCYKGLYHVLGGRFSPLSGVTPEHLHWHALGERLQNPEVKELILATSTDVEGQATAKLLMDDFQREGLTITRLAIGVPTGADLAYADAPTLAQALSARPPFS